jgi:PAS domain S-box-containing protein
VFADDLTGNYLASPDGTIIDCNAAFLSIFGFRTRRDARTTNMATLCADERAYAEFVARVRARRTLEPCECLRRRRDGLLVQLTESAVGAFDQGGELRRIHGRLFDSTALRLAERARREAEESYCQLLRSLPDPVLVSDAQDRILFANAAAAHLVGADQPDDLLGRSFLQFFTPREHPDEDESPDRPQHQQVVRLDGGLVDVETNQAAIQFDGSFCTLRVSRDICPRLRAEHALLEKDRDLAVQTAKIEKLNNALTALLEHRELESQRQMAGVRATLEHLVLAYLTQLNATPLEPDQRMLTEVMEVNLRDITSSFARNLESWAMKLTPTEMQITDLLRKGKSTKEIALLLRVSHSAVTFHRNNIRAKLGLTRQPINLVSYLRTMAQAARPAPSALPRRPRQRFALG